MREIVLPKQYFEYLGKAEFLTQVQRQYLDDAIELSISKVAMHLTDAVAEDFREAFTLRLTEVGFDNEYQPNEEGKILEDLIDLFFVGVMKR